jgi:hypothetical protein
VFVELVVKGVLAVVIFSVNALALSEEVVVVEVVVVAVVLEP